MGDMKAHDQLDYIRRNDMSNYELQIQATGQYYNDAIHAAEQENIEILSSVVSGSRLHEVIHNPIDSGIDEG
jgi:archaellum component FlaF (FlaF/FlaG flagellin family)